MRPIGLFALAVSLIIAASSSTKAAESASKAAKLTRLRLSHSTVNTRSAIVWIAEAQGSFAKYGLDVETIFLQSSNLQTAAIATNEVQIGNMGGATVLSGAGSTKAASSTRSSIRKKDNGKWNHV